MLVDPVCELIDQLVDIENRSAEFVVSISPIRFGFRRQRSVGYDEKVNSRSLWNVVEFSRLTGKVINCADRCRIDVNELTCSGYVCPLYSSDVADE